MARISRVVVPGAPHHVTQRGNRRQKLFYKDGDYALYRDLVAAAAKRARVRVLAWCLMPNHVHLIVVPADADGLRATFGEAHRRYTAAINARHRWTGHLFQGRFGSVAMDAEHLMAAVRYVAMNPVAAGLAARAQDWPWSSARAHIAKADDALVRVATLLETTGDFAKFLGQPGDSEAETRLLAAQTIGRPLGAPKWIARLEKRLNRPLTPARRGPKPKAKPAPRKGRVISKLSP